MTLLIDVAGCGLQVEGQKLEGSGSKTEVRDRSLSKFYKDEKHQRLDFELISASVVILRRAHSIDQERQGRPALSAVLGRESKHQDATATASRFHYCALAADLVGAQQPT